MNLGKQGQVMVSPSPVQNFIKNIAVGATLARLWLDFFEPDVAAVLLFFMGYALGHTWPRPRWTMWGLLIYLASPFPIPHLAILAVSLAVMGWIYQFSTKIQLNTITANGFGVAFLLFLFTLSPGLLPADAGEFQVVAAEWGVAHPPGYPLYTILAGTTVRLIPFNSMAWRVNLFSAIIGALTVALVTYTVQRETQKIWTGYLAGFALMVSTTFWMTSTQASIRPLTAFFTALMVESALAYRKQQGGVFPLIRFGLAAGLGVTHHGSLFFIGLALAVSIIFANPQNWKKWPISIAAAFVGILPLAYFLIRADGFLAPADLDTWDGFWNHVLARGFANDMFAYADPSYWPERWQAMTQVYFLQWHIWILVLALLGFVWSIYQDKWLGLTLCAAFLTHTIVVGTYRAPQTVEYALPAYVILAIALGYFIGTHKRSMILGTLVLSGLIFTFQNNFITMRRLASQEEARNSALATLSQTPDNGLILASWHRATPLWYLQQVENFRADANVRYVNPEGNLTPMQRWVNLIQAEVEEHDTVVVTQNFTEAYRVLPYTFENERILASPTPLAVEINLPNQLSLVTPVEFETNLYAGETNRFTLDWNVFQPVERGGISTFIHIGAADQPPIAQQDLFLQMNAAGKISLFYDVHIPITAPPGEWQVWVGAYTIGNLALPPENDEPRLLLGTVTIHPAKFPAPTQHPIFRDMGAANLIGWDMDNTIEGETILYLHWDLREKDHDYHIQIMDYEGGIWGTSLATTKNSTGYWASVHPIPSTIAESGVRVRLGDSRIQLPSTDENEHYILLGNIAALVDWNVKIEGDKAQVELTLLPFGASFEDIQIQLASPATADFTPVSGSIPSFKWAYNRQLTSVQTVENILSDNIQFLLYDGLTGRVIPTLDSRFTNGIPLTQ